MTNPRQAFSDGMTLARRNRVPFGDGPEWFGKAFDRRELASLLWIALLLVVFVPIAIHRYQVAVTR